MRSFVAALVLAGVLALTAAAPALAQETDPIAVLSSDAPFKEKADACRMLAVHADREAIPTLAALLVDEKLSHMARYALEPLAYPEVDEALRDALGKTTGPLKMGIINSLAVRKDVEAVPELIALLSGGDAGVAQTAAMALGTIATREAAKALEDAVARAGVSPGNLRALCDGLFRCAEAFAENGQRDRAIVIYDRLLEIPDAPRQIRTGALRGAVLSRRGKKGLPLLVEALRGESDDAFAAALRISRELGTQRKVTAALAEELPALSLDRKIRLIQVLGYRGGTAAGPSLLAEAEKGPIEVRVAALRALARMNYSPALDLMARLAWTEDGDLAKAARDSLSYFPGKDGEAALEAMLENDEIEARRVAIELVGQGGLDEPVDVLMNVAASDEDEGIRVAALKALEDYAGMEEMPGLLDRLLNARSQPEMEAAEHALAALSAREKGTPTASVVIKEAVYGDLPDGPSADVTKKVARIVKSGSLSVEASNGNFGDPAPGSVKQLRVVYTENGASVSKTVREGGTLRLTTASAPPAIVEALCAALEEAQGDAKLAVLRLLGSTGGRKALETVRTAASQNEGTVRETALRALCEWPTPDALPAIMDLVATSPDQTLKVLALRGAVRLLKQGEAGTAERLQHYAVLMDHAGSADERKLVLSGLAQEEHVDALEMALCELADESVRAEAVQAAISIANTLGKTAKGDNGLLNGKDLAGWQGNSEYWQFEDGAIVGHSDEPIPRSEFLWSDVEVSDFYLAVEVKLEPNSANSGVQFRSKKVDEHGQALGYQADVGQNVWGRLYHEHGRGKLDWPDRAEKAVKPGEWNRYEILAVGPAIWTAINGTLGVACLDLGADDERSGRIAMQLHAGPPQTVRYRIEKLVHDPKIELGESTAEQLIAELKVLKRE